VEKEEKEEKEEMEGGETAALSMVSRRTKAAMPPHPKK
jgi:hypothetical protein